MRRDGALLFFILLLLLTLCCRLGSRATEQGALPQHRSAPRPPSQTHRRTRGSVSNFLPARAATSKRMRKDVPVPYLRSFSPLPGLQATHPGRRAAGRGFESPGQPGRDPLLPASVAEPRAPLPLAPARGGLRGCQLSLTASSSSSNATLLLPGGVFGDGDRGW